MEPITAPPITGESRASPTLKEIVVGASWRRRARSASAAPVGRGWRAGWSAGPAPRPRPGSRSGTAPRSPRRHAEAAVGARRSFRPAPTARGRPPAAAAQRRRRPPAGSPGPWSSRSRDLPRLTALGQHRSFRGRRPVARARSGGRPRQVQAGGGSLPAASRGAITHSNRLRVAASTESKSSASPSFHFFRGRVGSSSLPLIVGVPRGMAASSHLT